MKKLVAVMLIFSIFCSLSACVGEKSDVSAESKAAADEASEASETPEVSEVSETPEVSEISEVSEVSEASEVSEVSEAPEVSEISEASEVSEAPESYERSAPAVVRITAYDSINKSDYVSCSITIEDPTGEFETLYSDDAAVKIRGNSTSSGAKSPYNIKFGSKVDVLGMGKSKKWYLLANMYDKSLMRNKLAYDFAAAIGMKYTQQSTYADVYLNGKYVGNYQLCESIGVGGSRVDINTEENDFLLEFEPWPTYSNPNYIYTPVCGILFGFNDPEEPTDEQLSYLRTLLTKAENALLSGDEQQIRRYWDVDSFVNDYIVHEYFKCVDAQTSSTRYYIEDGKIYGGPVWDFDLSSGNANPYYYTTYQPSNGDSSVGWWCNNGIWYGYFFRTSWFGELVKERFKELQPVIINLTDDNEIGKNRIDVLLDSYGESFKANFTKAGWSVTSKDSEYEGFPLDTYGKNVEFLRQWLRDRNKWMKDQWEIK